MTRPPSPGLDPSLPLAEVKAKLSEMINRVEHTHDRITITCDGRPVAVLISPDDLASMEATLDVLSDPDALAEIRAGLAAIASGDVVTGDALRARYPTR